MAASPRAAALRLTLAVVALLLLAGARPAVSQPAPPGEAIAAAVAALEADGYAARFDWRSTSSSAGEARYRSPTAYGLLVEDHTGAAFEYILLDPNLYSRRLVAGESEWGGWQRREWHPNVPVAESLTPYHPRLPLELLRLATDLHDAGEADGLRTIEGRVSYLEAISASYEDRLAPAFRQAAAGLTLPIEIRLDTESGRAEGLTLRVTPPADDPTPPSVLVYTFTQDAPALAAPETSEEVPSPLQLRPAPEDSPRALPLTVRGSGVRIVSPPFVATSGLFVAQLDAGQPEVQYRIWRIRRGRQLLASFGATAGGGGRLLLPLQLPPGEYVVEIELPASAEWTLTIEEAFSGDLNPRIHYAETALRGP